MTAFFQKLLNLTTSVAALLILNNVSKFMIYNIIFAFLSARSLNILFIYSIFIPDYSRIISSVVNAYIK